MARVIFEPQGDGMDSAFPSSMCFLVVGFHCACSPGVNYSLILTYSLTHSLTLLNFGTSSREKRAYDGLGTYNDPASSPDGREGCAVPLSEVGIPWIEVRTAAGGRDHAERYAVPWTFITLLAVSIITLASLLVTIILYNFTYLSPRFNVLLNGAIWLGWCLGLGLLSWSLSATLKKHCDVKTWGGKQPAAICRDYKALWAFTLVGTISTLLALVLDIHTNRKVTKSGVYISPEDDKNANDLKPLAARTQAYENVEE
ncbi:hypothetical protein B7494_g7781 [Chlorociboria aeruginascens]|nr:hypothetical protein B7494_g7781 [Chlorociboria aeruginascens]